MNSKATNPKLPADDLEAMRKLVGSIQRDVKTMSAERDRHHQITSGRPNPAQSPTYSLAAPNTPADYLFLDDKKTPGDVTTIDGFPENKVWAIVTSYDNFAAYLKKHGLPKLISFDFNLDSDKNGHDCAKYLVQYCLENNIDKLPNYIIHSELQTGQQFIQGYLMGFGKHKRIYKEKQAKLKDKR